MFLDFGEEEMLCLLLDVFINSYIESEIFLDGEWGSILCMIVDVICVKCGLFYFYMLILFFKL